MDALDEYGKRDIDVSEAEKSCANNSVEPIDISSGSLQEIEVDLAHAVHDQEVKDLDADTSPYPEVVSPASSAFASVIIEQRTASSCSRDG